MSLSEQHYIAIDKAIDAWGMATKEQEFNTTKASTHYQVALGFFAQCAESNDPDVLGLASRFCYEYTGFLHQKKGDHKTANRVYNMGMQYADNAIRLNPHCFNARYTQTLVAFDNLGPKPDFFTDGGGLFGKMFNQGRYQTAKTNYYKSVAALLDAYVACLRREVSMYDLVQWSEDLMNLALSTAEYEFDYSNLYETILAVDAVLEKISIIQIPEEESRPLVESLLQVIYQARSQLALQPRKR